MHVKMMGGAMNVCVLGVVSISRVLVLAMSPPPN